MSIRILKVVGDSEAAREAHLAELKAWMGRYGWRLTDYATEAGTALFERADGAPPLSRLHPTRWLPGPAPWRPRELWRTVRADPRLAVAAVALLFAVFVAVQTVRNPPAFVRSNTDLQALAEGEHPETWRYVNADVLNVRAGPSTQHQVVGVLYRNQRVLVEAVEDGWAKLTKPERGYVAQRYIQDVPAQ